MKASESSLFFDGLAGKIETIVETPASPRGIVVVCHPHPLFGGTHTNKVVHTLARVFVQMDYIALRPNFRGVGASEGFHDHGEGETDDMLALLAQARVRFGDLPVALAGFSFGAYVQTRVAERLSESNRPAQGLALVGLATGQIAGPRQYTARHVASDTLVVHGSTDETEPLTNVLAWAEPQELPIIVLPGADHFFHRRLHKIREVVSRYWPH